MVTKIDFKNFKKGDNVIITLSDKGKEENLVGKITNISYDQQVIFFEDEGSDYECKFSEIKKIVFNVNFDDFKKDDNVTITVMNKGKEEVVFGKITSISDGKICIEDTDSSYECSFAEIKSIALRDNSKKFDKNTFAMKIVGTILIILFILSLLGEMRQVQNQNTPNSTTSQEAKKAYDKLVDVCMRGKFENPSWQMKYDRRQFCECTTILSMEAMDSYKNVDPASLVTASVATCLKILDGEVSFSEGRRIFLNTTEEYYQKRKTMEESHEAAVHKKLVELYMENDFDNPTLRKKYNRSEFCECTSKLSMSAANTQRNSDPYVVAAMATASCFKILDGDVSYEEGRIMFLNELR